MKILRLLILLLFILPALSNAEVLFYDDFDSHPDWSPTQPAAPFSVHSYPGDGDETTIPSGYYGYYIFGSYYTDRGNNTLEISSANAYGGTGKALTFWCESDTRNDGYASDAQLFIDLSPGYDDIYLSHWIKFQPNWQWSDDEVHIKVDRITHYWGEEPWEYFDGGNQHPLWNNQLDKYSPTGYPSFACAVRYENVYYPENADPYHIRSVANYTNPQSDYAADGLWHRWTFRVKKNSAPGVPDGIVSMWIDDVLIYTIDDWAFSDTGSTGLPWNMAIIGGNVRNWFAPNESEAEQWYAIDGVTVATTYAEAVNPTGTPTYDPPTITGPDDFSTSASSVEINGSYTRDVNLPDQSVVVTWTLGESSGFCVAALGVFSCTVPVELGANNIVFAVTDSNSGTANDSITVTRTAPSSITSTSISHGVLRH